jgi:hypothetical protein
MAATGDNYTFDANTVYTYDDGVAGNQKFGVDIATDGSSIYALFIRGPDVFKGNYVNSTVVKLPQTLGNTPTAVNANLAPNAVNLKLWTDSQSTTYIYIPAIGGKQNDDGTYNAGSKIQRVDAATLQTLDTLLINAASGTGGGINTTDYYDIAFNAAGTKVFILKGIYDPPPEGSSLSVGPFNWYLFGTNMGAINAKAPSGGLINTVTGITSTSGNFQGYVWALEYDVADDKTWFAQGNQIAVYDYTNGPPARQGGTLGMGAGSSYLAPADFFLNGVSVYGVVGTINGAQSPSNASVQAPAAEEEE